MRFAYNLHQTGREVTLYYRGKGLQLLYEPLCPMSPRSSRSRPARLGALYVPWCGYRRSQGTQSAIKLIYCPLFSVSVNRNRGSRCPVEPVATFPMHIEDIFRSANRLLLSLFRLRLHFSHAVWPGRWELPLFLSGAIRLEHGGWPASFTPHDPASGIDKRTRLFSRIAYIRLLRMQHDDKHHERNGTLA